MTGIRQLTMAYTVTEGLLGAIESVCRFHDGEGYAHGHAVLFVTPAMWRHMILQLQQRATRHSLFARIQESDLQAWLEAHGIDRVDVGGLFIQPRVRHEGDGTHQWVEHVLVPR